MLAHRAPRIFPQSCTCERVGGQFLPWVSGPETPSPGSLTTFSLPMQLPTFAQAGGGSGVARGLLLSTQLQVASANRSEHCSLTPWGPV